ncbi:hypothetical protein Verru16b_02166 [Lacunisphaera limnophila]|uniref:Uncharacterized protein n=1 Tax=Lacunisphaera limnophila TaxID=1838286 RepID=A0A1D8AW19_9BACT|nr:hypothetical protein [Lacunisphaera limnophila]AOS45090.1 hypothetical protein Verru16b_02166 [Lacunisphaera limnophila]
MPAATQDISETLIRDNINRAVCDVFKTMLHRVARLGAVSISGGPEACPRPCATKTWPPTPKWSAPSVSSARSTA